VGLDAARGEVEQALKRGLEAALKSSAARGGLAGDQSSAPSLSSTHLPPL
jgi:hypothetical protein